MFNNLLIIFIFKVLENVQAEFLDYNGTGANIMGTKKYFLVFINILVFLCIELSHRSSTFGKVIQDAERDIREIL
jgi:phosphoserine aminotransferase